MHKIRLIWTLSTALSCPQCISWELGNVTCFSIHGEKKKSRGHQQRQPRCLNLIPDSPGVRIPFTGLHQRASCLCTEKSCRAAGVAIPSREYFIRGPSPSDTHARLQRALPRTMHGLRQKGAKACPAAGEVWHPCCLPGVWGGNAPWYPASPDKSASCSLQCWGCQRVLYEREEGKSCEAGNSSYISSMTWESCSGNLQLIKTRGSCRLVWIMYCLWNLETIPVHGLNNMLQSCSASSFICTRACWCREGSQS